MRPTITAEKAALRRRARSCLRELSPAARRESDGLLFARFLSLPQVARAGTLLLYHGMGAEPDTALLLPPLWAAGKQVCLPRCLPDARLEARLVGPDSALIVHPLGMAEPGTDCPLAARDRIDLVLVPGLAFDGAGGRLGQGGGYYDRFLAGYAGFTAALCRKELLLDRVPREGHDLGVDLVITEEGLYGPSAPGAAKGGACQPRPAAM